MAAEATDNDDIHYVIKREKHDKIINDNEVTE